MADLGEKKLMMLRNHGTLSVGMTAAECWLGMFFPGTRLRPAGDVAPSAPVARTRWSASTAQDEVRLDGRHGHDRGPWRGPAACANSTGSSPVTGIDAQTGKRHAAAILGVAAAFFACCFQPVTLGRAYWHDE